MNFFDVLDTYAHMHDMNRSDAWPLWCSGEISATELLDSYLEDEGIYGYTESIIEVIGAITRGCKKDGYYIPWEN